MEAGSTDARAALALWSAFPVTSAPRPLVLLGSIVQERGRFDSEQAKVAYLNGALDARVPLPPSVLAAMCPHGAVGTARTRLAVTTVEPTLASFLTDRGHRDLPAWRLSLSHFNGTVTVLNTVAVHPWLPAALDPAAAALGQSADLHEDGRTLTLSFVGAPRAYADYPHATVAESDTAALVLPVVVDRPSPGTVRPLHAERRQVTATLARPLGARVLLIGDGRPVPVTPAQSTTTSTP